MVGNKHDYIKAYQKGYKEGSRNWKGAFVLILIGGFLITTHLSLMLQNARDYEEDQNQNILKLKQVANEAMDIIEKSEQIEPSNPEDFNCELFNNPWDTTLTCGAKDCDEWFRLVKIELDICRGGN